MKIPEKIYKYQPATVQSLINLKSQYIYFNSSKKFNDPFGGNIKLKYEDINEKDIDVLKKSFFKDLIDEIYHPEVINFSFIEFSEALKEMGYKVIEDRTQNLYRNKGISCFSERKDSQLMWSHYASSGKGFCLEFDTKKEPFQKLLPVKYEDKPPLLDFMKIVSLEKNYLLRKLLCLKSSDWAYEKEWRCFHNETNKSYV